MGPLFVYFLRLLRQTAHPRSSQPQGCCVSRRLSSLFSQKLNFKFTRFILVIFCVRLRILVPHNHKVAASLVACLPCSDLKQTSYSKELFSSIPARRADRNANIAIIF